MDGRRRGARARARVGVGGGLVLVFKEAVDGVAFDRTETGIADEPLQILFCGVIVRARCGHDIFLNHDAAHVVGAKPQRDLPQLESLRQPVHPISCFPHIFNNLGRLENSRSEAEAEGT